MAMTDEQRLRRNLIDARRKHDQAEQENRDIDRQIEALDEAWMHVNNALGSAQEAIAPIYQTRYDSDWKGTSRDEYNKRIDSNNQTGNECVQALRTLLDQIRARQSELRSKKNNLADLQFEIDKIGASLNYLMNKASHLGQ